MVREGKSFFFGLSAFEATIGEEEEGGVFFTSMAMASPSSKVVPSARCSTRTGTWPKG